MKVLLQDVDSKIPNLALMKLSAWHRARGDTTFLNRCPDPDKVYISCIYSRNGPKARGLQLMYDDAELGGSGVDLQGELPEEVEHTCPDYKLYPGTDYSMGFTSRGCIRKCPFCVVPVKERWDPNHAEVDEFLRHDKLVLLDNNLTASPRFETICRDLIERGVKVSFSQGLDIRLMDEERAALLADVQAYNLNFKNEALYFAWDSMGLEDVVKRGVRSLLDAGIPGRHIMVYVLMGYDTTIEEDEYRAVKLTEWGVEPYAMLYNKTGSPELRALVRKVNRKWIWYSIHPRGGQPQ